MDEQTKQLTGLLEDMMYDFGTYNMDGTCCENISHGEYRALRTVMRMDKCNMQDIAKSIAVTKSGATRIVSRLEEKKLVRKIQDKNDGRVCCVQLSKEGKSLILNLAKQPAKKITAVLAAMEPNMRKILLTSLQAFFQTFSEQTAEKSKNNWNKSETKYKLKQSTIKEI